MPSLLFDDRLATVLSQPMGSIHDRVVRWRQLVDLVARSEAIEDRTLLSQAIAVIRTDFHHVREPLRAAAARSISGKAIPLALLRVFAADKLSVAAPLFSSVRLSGHALAAVRADASPDVAALLDRLFPASLNANSPAEGVSSIEELVARIERMRSENMPRADHLAQGNETGEEILDASRLATAIENAEHQAVEVEEEGRIGSSEPDLTSDQPVEIDHLVDEVGQEWPIEPANAVDISTEVAAEDMDVGPSMFRWESNPQGEIDWVDGVPRGAMIGRSLVDVAVGSDFGHDLGQALQARSPFRDCPVDLGGAGAVHGTWTLGGAPVFTSGDGRFVGYRGVARKGLRSSSPATASLPVERLGGPDALRELIHEIKTPLNAIIGFAEIIDGQYFGPAHRHYRLRAAQIVANARLLLRASDDLDFVARHQSGRVDEVMPAELRDFAAQLNIQLSALASHLGVTLKIDDGIVEDAEARVAAELAGRLSNRLVEALLGVAQPGEQLIGTISNSPDHLTLTINRPAAIGGVDSQRLIHPEYSVEGEEAYNLGLGFSLRLVNGLAGLAGSRLEIDEQSIRLIFPLVSP